MKSPMGWWMLSALALLGCKETVSSENIRTGGIAMLTDVIATSNSRTRVHTELRVGGDESNTFVILDDSDRLYAYADGQERPMREVAQGVYEAEFGTADEGTEFEVVLEREDDDTAACSGRLPAPFDITSDFGPVAVSRDEDDLELTWEPSDQGDRMRVGFDDGSSTCIRFEREQDIPDDGSFVLQAGTLESSDSMDPETCRIEAVLARLRNGTTDALLDDESRFSLRQERRVEFISRP
jgi:hypothetical protein